MRTLVAAAVLAGLAGPVYAQTKGLAPEKTPLDLVYERQERDRKAIEQDYNTTMKRLKSQAPTATSDDPWRTVRPTTGSNAKR
jgi:hypothetical protein